MGLSELLNSNLLLLETRLSNELIDATTVELRATAEFDDSSLQVPNKQHFHTITWHSKINL